jgi:hypothetical protein
VPRDGWAQFSFADLAVSNAVLGRPGLDEVEPVSYNPGTYMMKRPQAGASVLTSAAQSRVSRSSRTAETASLDAKFSAPPVKHPYPQRDGAELMMA